MTLDHDDLEQILFIPTRGAPIRASRSLCAQITNAAQAAGISGLPLSEAAAFYFIDPDRTAQGFLDHLRSLPKIEIVGAYCPLPQLDHGYIHEIYPECLFS